MTLERTTLGYKNVGQAVNLEVDVLAKYVEQLLSVGGVTVARGLDTIERAIEDIRAGRAIVVVDDEDRESEGDLIFAASRSGTAAAGLHDQAHQRRGVTDGGARARSARVAAHDPCQRGARAPPTPCPWMPRRHHHRDLRIRSCPHHPQAGGFGDRAVRAHPAGSRLPAPSARRASCAGPVTPKPPSTWPAWPAYRPQVSCARSSTTTAPWPGCLNCAPSPTGTGSPSSLSRT